MAVTFEETTNETICEGYAGQQLATLSESYVDLQVTEWNATWEILSFSMDMAMSMATGDASYLQGNNLKQITLVL